MLNMPLQLLILVANKIQHIEGVQHHLIHTMAESGRLQQNK